MKMSKILGLVLAGSFVAITIFVILPKTASAGLMRIDVQPEPYSFEEQFNDSTPLNYPDDGAVGFEDEYVPDEGLFEEDERSGYYGKSDFGSEPSPNAGFYTDTGYPGSNTHRIEGAPDYYGGNTGYCAGLEYSIERSRCYDEHYFDVNGYDPFGFNFEYYVHDGEDYY
jgi:hypothetical protein